ncbi:MAG: hypothetical protein R2844_23165 [Caldilineales bacterium]
MIEIDSFVQVGNIPGELKTGVQARCEVGGQRGLARCGRELERFPVGRDRLVQFGGRAGRDRRWRARKACPR